MMQKPGDRRLSDRDLFLPEPVSEFGQRDVRLADLRVVGRQRLIDDLRLRVRHLDHSLGKLLQRELVRVTDVDGAVIAGFGECDDPAD